MPISYLETERCFKLDTPASSYVMQLTEDGFLAHLYYGGTVSDTDLSYLHTACGRAFSPNPGWRRGDSLSLDTLPQEFSCNGTGDFRTSAVSIRTAAGNTATSLRYVSHSIHPGKPALEGLPHTYCNDDAEADTLEIELADEHSGAQVTLSYTAFRQLDAITRHVRIRNASEKPLQIERLMSVCVDFDDDAFDFVHLYGCWAGERRISRRPLAAGKQSIESKRGASSHQHNPFAALASRDASERTGEVYGFSLVYSGNFLAEAEVDQFHTTRFIMGINPVDFEWLLEPGQSFCSPEAILVFSGSGFSGMSHTFHRLFRKNLCRGFWRDRRRPVVINSWEAAYFQFDDDSLFRLAERAARLGIDLLVMDDGWFGARNDDTTSLGDWYVNTAKLKGGLEEIVKRVNDIGVDFGIWFEPEMISKESALYRAHPDWCLHVDGLEPSLGRSQLVLDMTREEVVDYLFEQMKAILTCANIRYVKWDFNRHLTEAGSAALPAGRQKEVFHRFVLGTYRLLDRLTQAFPEVLFEGCSGGGGRFDAGMLYYCPQIWTSDDTDAIERVAIQAGTSLVYPLSAMSAHVSASPNQQTGRVTDFRTRSVVAMTGAFGYELDLAELSEEEEQQVKEQIAYYRRHYQTIADGAYYRLTDPAQPPDTAAWAYVAADKKEVLVSFVLLKGHPNQRLYRLRIPNLLNGAVYEDEQTGRRYHGDTLMNAGIAVPLLHGDGASFTCCLKSGDGGGDAPRQ